MKITRRTFLQIGTGAALASAAHTPKSSQANSAQPPIGSEPSVKIRIAYPTIAAGLPLFFAVEKGLFKSAGLDVEAVKFASPQGIAGAMIKNQFHGFCNGTPSSPLGIVEIASPGLFKIIAANFANAKYPLDQVIVSRDSPIQSIADLKGKKVGCGPNSQYLALAREILLHNGVEDAEFTQLEFSKHPALVGSGQLDAALTVEPMGTIGNLKEITRVLESGVVAKYILGSPMAPWFVGSATLTTKFIKDYPETAKKYIASYRQAIDAVRAHPDAARPYLEKYTPIKGNLIKSVPLPGYTLYDEFTTRDIEYFNKFFDFLHSSKLLARRVEIAHLLYTEA